MILEREEEGREKKRNIAVIEKQLGDQLSHPTDPRLKLQLLKG